MRLTEDEFESKFTLVKNHLNNDASLDGCMFETYGAEVNYIASLTKTKTVWTYLEGEDDCYFVTGMHLVNCIGYLVSKEKYTEDYEVKIDTTGCDEEPETLDQLIAEHGSRIKGFLKD